MKKTHIYVGIGLWLALLAIISVAVLAPGAEKSETAGAFSMNEVVTHELASDRSIAVRVTDASIVIDSETPQVCILGECWDDRDPGKYVLTVGVEITNLAHREYTDGSYHFKIEDARGDRHEPVGGLYELLFTEVAKGETYRTDARYVVDPPISDYTLVIGEFGSDAETRIRVDQLQEERPRLCQGSGMCFAGFVKDVMGADAMEILDVETGVTRTVELSGVIVPAPGERNHENAASFVEGFCPVGSYALFDQNDGQEAIAGDIFCEGESVREQLLGHGLAVREGS